MALNPAGHFEFQKLKGNRGGFQPRGADDFIDINTFRGKKVDDFGLFLRLVRLLRNIDIIFDFVKRFCK